MTGLWMIFGPHLGCGKTAFLTWLGHQHKNSGKTIFANYQVTFADWIAPAEILMMKKLENCTILIDELWTIIDSRQSLSGENKFLNDIILASRKRGVTIAGTSQMPHMLDKRFRDIADYRVLCTRRGKDRSTKARIKAWIATADVRAPMGITLTRENFKVAEVADLYDTTQIIEQNKRLFIQEMSRLLKEDKDLMQDLYSCENITEQRELLQTYAGIKRSLQVAILKGVGAR
jgi:hypothetical protein